MVWATHTLHSTQVVETLVQGMVDVDSQDDRSINTPLKHVAGGVHGQMIETLVQTKADVDA